MVQVIRYVPVKMPQSSTITHTFSPLSGKDVIGLAETGSGKTGAFALPILQSLLSSPQRLHTLVLTPTRELAFQISEQFEALGSSIGVKTGMEIDVEPSKKELTDNIKGNVTHQHDSMLIFPFIIQNRIKIHVDL